MTPLRSATLKVTMWGPVYYKDVSFYRPAQTHSSIVEVSRFSLKPCDVATIGNIEYGLCDGSSVSKEIQKTGKQFIYFYILFITKTLMLTLRALWAQCRLFTRWHLNKQCNCGDEMCSGKIHTFVIDSAIIL